MQMITNNWITVRTLQKITTKRRQWTITNNINRRKHQNYPTVNPVVNGIGLSPPNIKPANTCWHYFHSKYSVITRSISVLILVRKWFRLMIYLTFGWI